MGLSQSPMKTAMMTKNAANTAAALTANQLIHGITQVRQDLASRRAPWKSSQGAGTGRGRVALGRVTLLPTACFEPLGPQVSPPVAAAVALEIP